MWNVSNWLLIESYAFITTQTHIHTLTHTIQRGIQILPSVILINMMASVVIAAGDKEKLK